MEIPKQVLDKFGFKSPPEVTHHDDDGDEVEPIYLWRMVADGFDLRAFVIADTDNEARELLNKKYKTKFKKELKWHVEEVVPIEEFPFLVCSMVDGNLVAPGNSNGLLPKH